MTSNGYRKVIKYSYGVACCSYIETVPYLLLVKKRYTYAFADIVNGTYDYNDRESIRDLINKTTIEEKLDLLSMNFPQIWYRVWLSTTISPLYSHSRLLFEKTFVADGGKFLRATILSARNVETLWDVPKGRKKKSYSETDIMTAIREFGEETGVMKSHYTVFPFDSYEEKHEDRGVGYSNKYFVSLCPKPISPKVSFVNTQISEVIESRWMSLQDIKFIDKSGRLTAIAKFAFGRIKKRMRNMHCHILGIKQRGDTPPLRRLNLTDA